MDYNKKSQNYKGQTYDCANHLVDVFSDGKEIHAVYNMSEEANRYIAKEDISAIVKDPDKYLFTPYIEFV
jgi:hypothetical protein